MEIIDSIVTVVVDESVGMPRLWLAGGFIDKGGGKFGACLILGLDDFDLAWLSSMTSSGQEEEEVLVVLLLKWYCDTLLWRYIQLLSDTTLTEHSHLPDTLPDLLYKFTSSSRDTPHFQSLPDTPCHSASSPHPSPP